MEAIPKGEQAEQIHVNNSLFGVESNVPLRKVQSEIIDAGFGIITEKRIEANEDVFRIKQPLISVLTDERLHDTCDNCLLWIDSPFLKILKPTTGFRILRYGGCHVSGYCSKACQKLAWKRHHKAECKIYGSHRSEVSLHNIRATIRLLHLRSSGQLSQSQLCNLVRLRSHRDKFKTAGGSDWLTIEKCCQNIKTITGTDVEEEALEEIFCAFLVNCMSMMSQDGMVMGSCLDPVASLMNHSCDPNSFLYFEGLELRVRSTRTIAAGEEITMTYIDYTEGFESRRNQLRSGYHFTCNCKICEKGATGPREFRTGDLEFDRRIKEEQDSLKALLESIPDANRFKAIEEKVDQICREGYQGKHWPCNVQPMPYLQKFLAHYYEAKNLVKSFEFWLKICFETDPLIWTDQYNPERVYHFMCYVGVHTEIMNLLVDKDPKVQQLKHLKEVVRDLQYSLLERLVEDCEKCFGRDSTMVKVAVAKKQFLENLLKQRISPLVWDKFQLFRASSEAKTMTKQAEKKLLEWACNFEG